VQSHAPELDHVAWVRSLDAQALAAGVAWLEAVAAAAREPWCSSSADASGA
jgi:hypothetical protein